MHVFVRIRPLLKHEDEPAWIISNNNVSCLQSKSVRDKVNRFVHSKQRFIEQQMQ
jgi:hypothetical protein